MRSYSPLLNEGGKEKQARMPLVPVNVSAGCKQGRGQCGRHQIGGCNVEVNLRKPSPKQEEKETKGEGT